MLSLFLKVTSMNFGPRFNPFARAAFFAAVLAVTHGIYQGFAFAGGVVIQTPTTLQGGDKFRIIFVTPGTIQATSSDIKTYNDFVNVQAAGATYEGATVHWSAIVSTDAVKARDNIGLTNSGVYMADGTQVATAANTVPGGLWWGDPLLADPVQDLTGNTYSGSVWTGTCGIGTEFATLALPYGADTKIIAQWGLGNSTNFTRGGVTFANQVEVGNIGGGGYTWISTGVVTLNTTALHIYAISDVLTVVPEPSTFMISGLGIFVIGFAQKLRKRNRNASLDA